MPWICTNWAADWGAVEAVGTWLAAVGTLAAVTLALYPIRSQAADRRARANGVRRQLLTALTVLQETYHPRLEVNTATPLPTGQGVVGAEKRLRTLFTLAHELDPVEQDHLTDLVAALDEVAVQQAVMPTQAAQVVKSTGQLIEGMWIAVEERPSMFARIVRHITGTIRRLRGRKARTQRRS